MILVAAEQALRYHERQRANRDESMRSIKDMNLVDATAVGIGQAVAIIPGISRSGSTIGGRARVWNRTTTMRLVLPFSWLFRHCSAPPSSRLPKLGESTISLGAGIAGFVLSLVTSYAAIAGLIRYLKTRTLYPFAVYCAVAGVVFYLILR